MSFITVPSMPTMPDGLLNTSDQAEVLADVQASGPMTLGQAAKVLKIPRERALHLRAVWEASSELQALIREHGIGPEPAGLLARIETLSANVARRLARAYVQRRQTTAGLRQLLDYLLLYNTTEPKKDRTGSGR